MPPFKDASVFVYALNETHLFEKVVEIILNTCSLSDIKELVLVVSDKSTLECRKTAKKIFLKYPDHPLKIFYQKRNGLGGAVQDSFEIAQGSHFIGLEADMGTDPNLVHVFIEKIKEDSNRIITASRWLKGGGFSGYGKIKKFINYCYQIFISILFNQRLTDSSFTFMIIPTSVVKMIKWESTLRSFIAELGLKPVRLGIPHYEIPAKWVRRDEGKSSHLFIQNLKFVYEALKIRFTRRKKILKKGND